MLLIVVLLLMSLAGPLALLERKLITNLIGFLLLLMLLPLLTALAVLLLDHNENGNNTKTAALAFITLADMILVTNLLLQRLKRGRK